MSEARRNALLLACSCVTALVIGEVVLRVIGVSFPVFGVRDPILGWRLRAGARGWYASEGRALIEINRDGHRDREHAHAKPPGTFRIAVLGDSYAEALQVPLEKTFWAVLERRLSGCPSLQGRVPEVLNFGVSGYGTAQELLMLRSDVWQYAPDLVLLAFLPANDVRNNSRTLEPEDARPFFVYEAGLLVENDSFRTGLRFRSWAIRGAELAVDLLNRSHLLQLLREAAVRPGVDAGGERFELGLDAAVFSPPADERWREAWRVTEGLLAQMQREVRANGAVFWIATLSAGFQVLPSAAIRDREMRRMAAVDAFYPDRRVEAFAERRGIPFVMLAPPLQEYAQAHGAYLHGFTASGLGKGHWNEEGHRLAGEILARRLCEGPLTGTPGRRRPPVVPDAGSPR